MSLILKDHRPTKIQRIMIEIELKSQWATCQRLRVGSAIVDNYVIVVPAYNGTPKNQPNCIELTDTKERCQFCVHSERNAINHAARLGVSTQSKELYTLYRPCLNCSNDIVQAGISAVYYRHNYDSDGMFNYVGKMFSNNNIFFKQLLYTEAEQRFTDTLNVWRELWDAKFGSQDMLSD